MLIFMAKFKVQISWIPALSTRETRYSAVAQSFVHWPICHMGLSMGQRTYLWNHLMDLSRFRTSVELSKFVVVKHHDHLTIWPIWALPCVRMHIVSCWLYFCHLMSAVCMQHFKCILINANSCMLIQISLKFVARSLMGASTMLIMSGGQIRNHQFVPWVGHQTSLQTMQ